MKVLVLVSLAAIALVLLLFVGLQKPVAEPVQKEVVVKGNNQFGLDLYGKLRDKDGNLFFSPYSISTALAMTYAGARGQTAEEMAKTLHFDLDHDKLHPAFKALQEGMKAEKKKAGYRLHVANALWGQKDYRFLPAFLQVTHDNYGVGLQEVDFVKATEQARKTINEWVEKQTENKIKELLQPGILDTMTRLVLTNAIYFKGDWASQFKKDATRDLPFKLGDGKEVKTPLMYQRSKFGYLETGDLQALELPYQGKDLSMVVLLPKKIDGLPSLEKELTTDRLAGWLGRMRASEVQVFLPKFKMTSEFALKPVLASLGMKKLFTVEADLSGMNGRTDLYVSAVIHKAYLDVNEEGTEAAAATAVVVWATSARPPVPVFRPDHPFLFLIRDQRTGSILFMGRLANPGQ
jgi:serine protease inhibitor